MSLDLQVLAERAAAVDRHLTRVALKLPTSASELLANTDQSDAVILHLWQATQIVLDIALGACTQLKLGTPQGFADAFVRLQNAGALEPALARRRVAASGFHNVVAHAYESLDMERVHQAATNGPSDLRTFLATIRHLLLPAD